MNDVAQPPAPVARRRTARAAKEIAAPKEVAPAEREEARSQEPAATSDRPPLRTELRPDPRQSAEDRAREILEHGGLQEMDGTDEFYISPSVIPDGWTYEWKRQTVYGMADPAYEVSLARTGWVAVPASRHPEMMPQGWTGNTITRKGQVLMERPKVITDMVEATNKRKARDQVRVKEQQLSSAPAQGQLPRAGDEGGDPRTKPKISRAYEPMPVPQDKK